MTAVRRLLNERCFVGVLPDGNFLVFPLDDFKILSIISEIYHKRIYDAAGVRSFKYVCDVGSHIGLFTLRISKIAPSSRIIAVEPNPVNYKLLLRNISINGIGGRVLALNVAAGRARGRSPLFLSETSRGDSSLIHQHSGETAGVLQVDVVPLSEILADNRVCDLLKVDVEGMEGEVLKGLGKQRKTVNRLVVEIHKSVVEVAEIRSWLRNHSYKITRTEHLYGNCQIVEAQSLSA
jgi:FkbM family methyltransferase